MGTHKFFLGASQKDCIDEVISHSAELSVWKPFDDRSVRFVGKLAQKLLTHSDVKKFPEMIAMGHWFRLAKIRELAKAYPSETDGSISRGRGLVFHLAPANVDSIFMYSWLISLLAGNPNIVRVSQNISPQFLFLLEVLAATIEDFGEEISGRIVILTYPHESHISSLLSQSCFARVVWGGNSTVATVRPIPLRPTAVEMCFPDRFSASVMRSEEILIIPDIELSNLVVNFCNDAFWFAQQACSSPKMLAWVGSPDACSIAKERFWSAVRLQVAINQTENSSAMAMSRLNIIYQYAAREFAYPVDKDNTAIFPSRVELEGSITSQVKELHAGNGMFLESSYESLQVLAGELSDKEQTLGIYGFSRDECLMFLDALPQRSVDRLVPIGSALEFDYVWDGVDLFQFFTRKISIPNRQLLR